MGVKLQMGKIRGVSAPHNKNTQFSKPVILPVPEQVHLPMSMHTGKPAKPVVSVGEDVKVGQLIGEADGFVSSPVHAGVSGKVKSIDSRDKITGQLGVSITISSDGEQTAYENLKPPSVTNLSEFLAAVRDSGVVGLGGAGYPTAPKLTFKESVELDYILINGAECEPYITSDTRTMIDDAEYVFEGVLLLKKFIKPKKIIICIENNKPEAIEKMRAAISGENGVEVRELPSLYPQGERKVLVYNVTGRIVPEGGRLADVGCTVLNCATVSVFAKYIKLGTPLVSKVITVDGSAVKYPNNVVAPIGTPIRYLFEFCGGLSKDTKKILLGGPMMGIAAPTLDTPIVKTTNAALAFKAKDAELPAVSACIRCGRCAANCPIRLMTLEFERAYQLKRPDLLERYKVNLCIECGCCAYICPAHRPLLQSIKLAKTMLKDYKYHL